MQTIQMMILLLDGFIKLAPWRIAAQTMDRISRDAGESLARVLRIVAIICVGFCAFQMASLLGPFLLTGCFGGVIPPHVPSGRLVLNYVLFGFYSGMALCAALWWRSRRAQWRGCLMASLR